MQLLKAGEFIDQKYEVIDVLGTGSFGSVYKAKQAQIDRLVAVKLLHQSVTDSEDIARFEREAKAMNLLKHKNIVTFYGFGFWNDAPYMVTELAQGESLFSLLARGIRVSRTRAITIAQQVLSGLSSAHKQGIIHRDLKPSNIILASDPDGLESLKIIDFGLAKLLPGYGIPSQKLTETGFALGTVQYMSPEQCTGAAVDARADLYAVGCILFQMLTGELPFDAADAVEVMYQQINLDPKPLDTFMPNDATTVALQKFCDNCLAKDPEQRYASADEALADIGAIAAGQSNKVRAFAPTSSSRRRRMAVAGPHSGRKKWIVAVASLVAAALGIAVVYCYSPPPADSPVVKKRTEAVDSVVRAEKYDGGLDAELRTVRADKDALLAAWAKDQREHNLTAYERARIGYLLALDEHMQLHYAKAEPYARASWNERRGATVFPPRARNLLLSELIHLGKFEEADEHVRGVTEYSRGGLLISVMCNAMVDYTFINRMDRCRALLESLRGMPALTPREKVFCYYFLGDTTLCLGAKRSSNAERYYEEGAAIEDPEGDFGPNPCWLGLARMALFKGDYARAHKYAKLMVDNGLFTMSPYQFPLYDAFIVVMASAAHEKDKSLVQQCTKAIDLLSPVDKTAGVDYMFALDDALAAKELNANGFADVQAHFAPHWDLVQRSAHAHELRPRLQQVDGGGAS